MKLCVQKYQILVAAIVFRVLGSTGAIGYADEMLQYPILCRFNSNSPSNVIAELNGEVFKRIAAKKTGRDVTKIPKVEFWGAGGPKDEKLPFYMFRFRRIGKEYNNLVRKYLETRGLGFSAEYTFRVLIEPATMAVRVDGIDFPFGQFPYVMSNACERVEFEPAFLENPPEHNPGEKIVILGIRDGDVLMRFRFLMRNGQVRKGKRACYPVALFDERNRNWISEIELAVAQTVDPVDKFAFYSAFREKVKAKYGKNLPPPEQLGEIMLRFGGRRFHP